MSTRDRGSLHCQREAIQATAEALLRDQVVAAGAAIRNDPAEQAELRRIMAEMDRISACPGERLSGRAGSVPVHTVGESVRLRVFGQEGIEETEIPADGAAGSGQAGVRSED